MANVQGVGPGLKKGHLVYFDAEGDRVYICKTLEIKKYGQVECMTKAIEIPLSVLYFVIGEQEGLFVNECQMEENCKYSQLNGLEFPPKVTEIKKLEDKKAVAFKVENMIKVQNLVPKVYFQGIVADEIKVY